MANMANCAFSRGSLWRCYTGGCRFLAFLAALAVFSCVAWYVVPLTAKTVRRHEKPPEA
jgi:hypothetical protein